MAWTYWNWVWCNIFISTFIFLLTLIFLIIIHWRYDRLFFGLVSKLFNIERCTIDVHHNIIKEDDSIDFPSSATITKIIEGVLHVSHDAKIFVDEVREGDHDIGKSKPVLDGFHLVDKEISNWGEHNDSDAKPSSTRKHTIESSKDSSSHPEYKRQILNIYGKYIRLHKITKTSITILTTITISATAMAAVDNLFLATTSVYRGHSCPNYGLMDCFCGNNGTYFQCNTGQNVSFPFDTQSGTCFRWIIFDITTSDLTTQIGVSTGFVIALGTIAECIIRLYLYVLNRRLNVAHGIDIMIAKTVGLNGRTAATRCCCCCYSCCHCGVFNLSKYKHPSLAVLLTVIYVAVPFLIIPAISLLYYYELNTTAVTFIILVTAALLCILSILWIVAQDDESSANVSGGWTDVKLLSKTFDETLKSSIRP